MTDFVRVLLENGSKASVSAAVAKKNKLTPLDEPAVDARGRVLAEEHPVDGEGDDKGPTIADLKAQIDRLNESREDGDKLSKSGNKDELIARLADVQ